MPTYFYQGFEVHYDIKQKKKPLNICCSKGNIISNPDWNLSALSPQFRTEAFTKTDAELEIKRLINKYIDFEWKKYLEIKEIL